MHLYVYVQSSFKDCTYTFQMLEGTASPCATTGPLAYSPSPGPLREENGQGNMQENYIIYICIAHFTHS